MTALILAIACLVALVVIVAVELRMRSRPRPKITVIAREPRRQPHIEDHVREALAETKHRFGDVFVSYRVWKIDRETRLELRAAPPWKRMSEFTRCIIMRHLWRALETAAKGSVVIVDTPPQRWSSEVNAKFYDRGVDPWKASPLYAAGRAASFTIEER
jgi:hypothetical protein